MRWKAALVAAGACTALVLILARGFGTDRQYGEQVAFLGVVFEDTSENVEQFLKRRPPTYPQLWDPLSQMAVDYGVAGVPETYFIDGKGIIRAKHVGPISPEELSARVKDLLQPLAEVQR